MANLLISLMDYKQALELLYSSVPAFHTIGAGAYKPGLDTSRRLDALAGHPHRRYATIHIAGTNGKGSTSHTLAAILASAGLRTGLYTSPHIFDFRERIRVDGRMIPESEVIDFVQRWLEVSREHPDLQPSFFELTSTLAFDYFARQEVDIAVIETGLGGRLDSTNIITPLLSVITNISLDHTALLGDTLPAIAAEKAGIIKPGVPVVIGEYQAETAPVFESAARECGSPLTYASPLEGSVTPEGNIYPSTPFGELRGELTGECQTRNAATVAAAVGILRDTYAIPDSAVAEGFGSVVRLTGLFGRWSVIAQSPLTVADTGHNEGGWRLIVDELRRITLRPVHLVIGFVADKDLSHILPLIAMTGTDREEGDGGVGPTLWFSAPSCQRGLKAEALAAEAARYGLHGTVEPDVNRAVALARSAAGKDGFVLVAGSNFLIADLRLPLPEGQPRPL